MQGDHVGLCKGALNPMMSVLLRGTRRGTDAEEKGEGDRKTEAEIGGMWPGQGAKESGQAPLELSVT